ncbi:MAG: SRPBCC family protein [Bacteroidota bacterium]
MPVIELHTPINAPVERCFLLSLSVDLHTESVAHSSETAIAGVTGGLMKLNDTVTWQAKHFGVNFKMTSHIPVYQKPTYFVSEMIKGPFQKLRHQHHFKEMNGQTIMTDIFELEAPLGILGKLAEKYFLTAHMKKFLIIRNAYIKTIAEGSNWSKYL